MTMYLVLKIFLGGAVVYAVIVGFVALNQRNMQYFPRVERISPDAVGLTGVDEIVLTTSEGVKVIAWWRPPATGMPTVLYFHGNAGSIADRADRFMDLTEVGLGLLALSYRGYGGSGGSPIEARLLSDGLMAFDHLKSVVSNPVVLYGESLGTGVAVHVAAHRNVGAVALEAPFTSALDVARNAYPFLPISQLMKDRYHSDRLIGQVKSPLVVIHGTEDNVIPFRLGEKLFALANEPKRFVALKGGGHNDLWRRGAFSAAWGVFSTITPSSD